MADHEETELEWRTDGKRIGLQEVSKKRSHEIVLSDDSNSDGEVQLFLDSLTKEEKKNLYKKLKQEQAEGV